MFDFIGLAKIVGEIVNKFIPDPDKAQELKAAIEMKLIEASTMQQQINMKEAEHSSMFVAGWRPFVGWICGLGCAYSFLLQPFITWIAMAFGGMPFPVLDMASLMGLLMGMLGLGGLRTYEKVREVARENGIEPFRPLQAVKKLFK